MMTTAIRWYVVARIVAVIQFAFVVAPYQPLFLLLHYLAQISCGN